MKQNKSFIYGLHAIQAVLNKSPHRILKLYIQKDRHDPKIETILASANRHSIIITYASKQELDQLSHQGVHQGIAADCQPINTHAEADLIDLLQSLTEPAFLLILDCIQ